MKQQTITNSSNNLMHQELINLFNSSGIPLHFNKTGNKEFTNYQRISLIIIFRKSRKSLRDFIEDLKESLWPAWLGLIRIPGKSTLHDWIDMFKMKTIRELFSKIKPKHPDLTAIDGTGLDSWQRSRHYERRIGEAHKNHMPYAKLDIFIDVKSRELIDFNLKTGKDHDAKVAKIIFKRNKLKGVIILADRGYDSEPLHRIVREKGGVMYAPVRKMCKTSLNQRPKGTYRRLCMKLPEYMGQRSIVESVNYSLKKKQICTLTAKKEVMKRREFAWHAILYNIRMITNKKKENLVGKATRLNKNFFLFIMRIYVFPDSAYLSNSLYILECN